MRCLLFLLALPIFLAPTSASAGARGITGDNFCRDGLFPQENQPLGSGIAGPRGAHVYYDQEVCHLEGSLCRTAHVPPGGNLLLGRHRDGLICIYFPKHLDSIVGWVKAGDVEAMPFDRNPPLHAWLGLWTTDSSPQGDPYIHFYLHKHKLMVKGESWTTGPEDHIGELDEEVHRTGYRAYDAECSTTFWLIGKFLVVADDHYSCFAPGADFEDVYLLKRR